MIYASVAFIYFILTGAVIFYALPSKLRNWFLLLLSWGWMASWRPEWTGLFFVIANLNFLGLRYRLYRQLIVLDVAIFFLLRSGGAGDFTFTPPYGTSFIMFMIMGSVFERWRNQADEDYRWHEYMLFSQFFLFLMGGPIEKSTVFLKEIRKNSGYRTENIIDGLLLMGLGFAKIIFVWELVTFLSHELRPQNLPWYFWPLSGLLWTWNVFLELSSLYDLGRGAARIFGIVPSPNFRPVMFAKNPNDYWLRWNISVGTWFRNNVTIPIMLRWGRKVPQDFIILFSFFLMGIWHGLGWNYVLFGLFNGALVVFFLWCEHKKSLTKRMKAMIGRSLALFMIIGNGLIPHLFEMASVHVTSATLGQIVFSGKGKLALISLGVVFIVEVFQEVKQDNDFFLRIPLFWRGVMATAMLVLFFYALNNNIINQRTDVDLPIYFKM